MDPFSALVLSLLIAKYFTKYSVQEAWAELRGNPSPRATDRASRAGGDSDAGGDGWGRRERGPGIGSAVRDRVADRIRNPPPPRQPKTSRGPMRDAVASWWFDVWDQADQDRRERVAARDRRRGEREAERRRRENAGARPEPPGPDDVVDAEVVEDDKPRVNLTKKPKEGSGERGTPPREPRPDLPEEPKWERPTRFPDNETDSPDDPQSDTTGGNPVPTPNGETTNPNAGSAFANDVAALQGEVVAQTDQSIASLTQAGVAGPVVDALREAMDAAQVARSKYEFAAARFAEHEAKRDDIASDEELKGTQKDSYLDGAKA